MSSRETRAQRGAKRGEMLVRRLVGELTSIRVSANLSQAALAKAIGWTQSDVSRFERLRRPMSISLTDISSVAAALGMEVSAGLHPYGDPIRDKGHQALIVRFRRLLAEAWRVAAEVPFPALGDPRAWDLVIRLATQIVGVEAETRVRDVQALARRIHQRQSPGGVHAIVIVLSATAVNRRLLPQLLEALGSDFRTPAAQILRSLRAGQPLPGSGVILV